MNAMLSISLNGLWAHKRRLAGTIFAVFLGVAFLSGTLVLTDTLRSSINGFFVDANKGTDAVIRNATSVDTNPGARRGPIDQALVDRVRQVGGVAAADPAILGYGQIVGRDGKAISGNGPRQAGNWIANPDLNPYRIVEGRPPQAADEVVINRGAAKDGGLHIGDATTVLTPQPVAVKVVGIATFGTADALGGTSFVAFDLASAQKYLTRQPGKITSILVKAAPGVPQTELVRRIRPLLPPNAEAITGAQLTQESMATVDRVFINLFRTFLTVFAGIALLVATFSIYNTFSIITAQRRREFALLRAVGASQRQVLGAVVVEALLVGLVASAAGLVGGLGIAALLKGVFAGLGFALPGTGLILTGATVAIAVPVGVLVTLLAGVIPAVTASRVPPLAALRDVATDRSGRSVPRAVAGLLLTASGVILTAVALLASGGVLLIAGLGALLVVAGVVVLGPLAAGPASGIIGSPLPRLHGITGALARRNAMRNPRRTAGAATALMVGVCVVTLFTVFGASLQSSIHDSVAQSFAGDLAITASGRWDAGLSPQLAVDVGKLPEVRSAAGLGTGTVLIDGTSRGVSIADSARLDEVLRLQTTAGSIASLGGQQLAISARAAKDQGWRLGSPVPVTFGDGAKVNFTVGAIYEVRDVVGDYVLDRTAWLPHAAQDRDSVVFVKLKDGVAPQTGQRAVEQVAAADGRPTVQNRQEYLDSRTQGVSTLLNLVYVMLALAIVIALMGIANTMSLSIYERTRELGLLRAVGQTRGQTRAMVWWESLIIAALGTVGGIALGVFLGWVLVRAAAAEQNLTGFAAPLGQLVVVLLVGGAAGVLAGLLPARRAAKLNVLRAVAAE